MNYGERRSEDLIKEKPDESFFPMRKPEGSRALDERCDGCPHPRNGVCPYIVTPRTRYAWPCYFMVHVEKSDPIEIPMGERRVSGLPKY